MRQSRHTSRTATIITIKGKMNTLSAPETRAQLGAVVMDGGARLVLDLSGVTFVDSMALSVLIATLKLARTPGGDLVLLRPTPPVRSLLEATCLDRIFLIFEDEESAAASFGE